MSSRRGNSESKALDALSPKAELQAALRTGKWRDSDNLKLIHHILKKHPELAKERFFPAGGTARHPLSFLVSSPEVPLEIIQDVYQMYPDVLEIHDNMGRLPLECAIRNGSSEVVKYLVEKNDSALSKRNGSHDRRPIDLLVGGLDHHPFDGEDFNKIFQLLYYPGCWKLGGGYYLKKLLFSQRTPPKTLTWLATRITPAELKLNMRRSIPVGSSWCVSFNKNLKHFTPHLQESCNEIKFNWHSNRGHDGSFLADLFREVSIPPSIAMHFQNLLVSNPQERYLPSEFDNPTTLRWDSCAVQEVRITDFNILEEDYNRLLKALQHLPNLERLHLRNDLGRVKFSCTDAIIDLLEKAGDHLDQLYITGKSFVVNTQKLSLALQTAQKPTPFVGCSATLSFHKPIYNTGIAYHSSMNRHGRTKIAAPNASRKLLVDCLCSAGECSYYESKDYYGYAYPENLEESVLYGLLREAPGLWASSSIEKDDDGNSGSFKKRSQSSMADPLGDGDQNHTNTKKMKVCTQVGRSSPTNKSR